MRTILDARPYQVEEVNFLRQRRRGCIWLPPGMGKTMVATEAAGLPWMISAPTYASHRWANWLRQHLLDDELKGHIHVCTGSNMDHTKRQIALLEAALDDHAICIVNNEMLTPLTEDYEMAGKKRKRAVTTREHPELRRDPRVHEEWVFNYQFPPHVLSGGCVTIDEAHWFRGRKAWRTKGAAKLFKRTPNFYQLTATPIYKDPDDLWAQLHILNPRDFSSYGAFVSRYMETWSDGWRKHVIGIKSLPALLAALQPYAMRHDYAPGMLPPVIEPEPIIIDPDPVTAARLRSLRNEYRDGTDVYFSAVEALTAIDRIAATCPAKLDALSAWLNDTAPKIDGTRTGAFTLCHYKETVRGVAEHLRKHTGSAADPVFYSTVDGDTPAERRDAIINGSHNSVVTWASCGESIDAAHMRLVPLYESYYTFGGNVQSVGRVVRPSPKNDGTPVIVQWFILKGSADQEKYNIIKHQRRPNAQEVLYAVTHQ